VTTAQLSDHTPLRSLESVSTNGNCLSTNPAVVRPLPRSFMGRMSTSSRKIAARRDAEPKGERLHSGCGGLTVHQNQQHSQDGCPIAEASAS